MFTNIEFLPAVAITIKFGTMTSRRNAIASSFIFVVVIAAVAGAAMAVAFVLWDRFTVPCRSLKWHEDEKRVLVAVARCLCFFDYCCCVYVLFSFRIINGNV